jgi:hypothetical protein
MFNMNFSPRGSSAHPTAASAALPPPDELDPGAFDPPSADPLPDEQALVALSAVAIARHVDAATMRVIGRMRVS